MTSGYSGLGKSGRDPGCHQELAYQYYHDLIAPYVMEEEQGFTQISTAKVFDRSVNELIQHTLDRIEKTELLLRDQ